jgi:hypothetical protein
MSTGEINKLRKMAYTTALRFNINHFKDKLQSIVVHGVTVLPQIYMSQKKMTEIRALKSNNVIRSSNIAVIIEYGINPLVEGTIRNAAHYLGPLFSIQLYHSELNAAFYRHLLKDLNVQFMLLPASIHLAEDYNQYLKSNLFWNNFQPECKVMIFSTETIFLRSPDKSILGSIITITTITIIIMIINFRL